MIPPRRFWPVMLMVFHFFLSFFRLVSFFSLYLFLIACFFVLPSFFKLRKRERQSLAFQDYTPLFRAGSKTTRPPLARPRNTKTFSQASMRSIIDLLSPSLVFLDETDISFLELLCSCSRVSFRTFKGN